MLSLIVAVAEQAPQSELSWWQTALLFVGGPVLLFAAIALPVLLITRYRPPPTFPRLAPGAVHARGDSRQSAATAADTDDAAATTRTVSEPPSPGPPDAQQIADPSRGPRPPASDPDPVAARTKVDGSGTSGDA